MTNPAEWMIYGANGYTGHLVAVEARRRGLRPVLAGRRAGPIETLAAELGLPARVFDLGDAQAAAAALADMAVVAHCAGPFSVTSAHMIDACLKSRTHYLDITGELDVFLAAQRRHAHAQTAGIVICPGVGFDVIPTDCLAAVPAAASAAEKVLCPIKMRGAPKGTFGASRALCPERRSFPLVNRWTTFRLCPAAFLEILSFIECPVLRVQFRQRVRLRRIDREMRGGQCRLDAEWPARGYFLGELDAGLKGSLLRRRNFLHHPHAKGFLRAPMFPRQHIAHGVSPSGFMHKANGCATAWEPAVGVFVLAEPGVGSGDADVGDEVKLMAHVPGVTVNDDNERLREPAGFCERIDGPAFSRARSIRCRNCRKRIDIDAP
jgi:hypothetical protein